MSKRRRKYTEEFTEEAVKLVLEHGYKIGMAIVNGSFYDNEQTIAEMNSGGYGYFIEWYIADNNDYDLQSTSNTSNKLINLVSKVSGNGYDRKYTIGKIETQQMSPNAIVLPDE